MRVVICGTERELVVGLCERIAEAGWEPQPVIWPDSAAFVEARKTAAGFVVTAREDDAAVGEVLELLSHRPEDLPVLVFGAPPGRDVRAAVWAPAVPPTPLLATMLRTYLGNPANPRSPTWRRKADMIIGSSPATKQLLQALDQLAPASTPVLIMGESGVGKELVARSLHYCGPRAVGSFVALNCAAIPETLFEAELFGHERGAFTGAVAARAGAIEAAHGGTLFLDELGEMPQPLQAKLLRVLETSEVQRLGSTEPKAVSFRLVSATNRNLDEQVREGRFREDLYYRINVYPVTVAPLRERPEDIPAIAVHHLAIISKRENLTLRLTPDAVDKLVTHTWPGNVRDLVNTLERATLLAVDGMIGAAQIVLSPAPNGQRATSGTLAPYRKAKADFEASYYTQLLKNAGGNITRAAKLAQKTRKEIYDALKRLDLDRDLGD